LIPIGTPLTNITQVEIEFYRVFPADSGPFDGKVPTRANSPARRSHGGSLFLPSGGHVVERKFSLAVGTEADRATWNAIPA
jgi:hypothetical protein